MSFVSYLCSANNSRAYKKTRDNARALMLRPHYGGSLLGLARGLAPLVQDQFTDLNFEAIVGRNRRHSSR
mgnify:CR=1 FL=1